MTIHLATLYYTLTPWAWIMTGDRHSFERDRLMWPRTQMRAPILPPSGDVNNAITLFEHLADVRRTHPASLIESFLSTDVNNASITNAEFSAFKWYWGLALILKT